MYHIFWCASSFNQVLCWNTSLVTLDDFYKYTMFYGSRGALSESPYPSCLHPISNTKAPSSPGYPSKAPQTTRPPTVSTSKQEICEDSTTLFEWNNGLSVDCQWVANHGEIACNQILLRAKCRKSCGACGESLFSSSPPSIMPRSSKPSRHMSASMIYTLSPTKDKRSTAPTANPSKAPLPFNIFW